MTADPVPAIVPAEADQVTPVASVLVTSTVKACLPPPGTVAVPGETATTGDGTVMVANAVLVISATL